MKKVLCLLGVVLAVAAVTAESRSSNTFAITQVTAATTNTIISVPWMGYTQDNSATLDIRADHLVSPRNLSEGDMLLVIDGDAYKTYKAWNLEPVTGSDTGAMEWKPIGTVDASTTVNSIVEKNDGTAQVKRGFGIWLVRKNPTKPFYLQGQWAALETNVTVVAGSAESPTCTMLAHPDPSQSVNVNSIAWGDGVNSSDTIIIPTDINATIYCQWDSGKKQWYHVKVQAVTKFGRTVAQSTKVYDDLIVPAGTGFWYVSRGGSPTIRWTAPAAE